MKTSFFLLIPLAINTAALISKSLANMLDSINTWILICAEISLLIALFIHKIIKGFKQELTIDLSNLKWFSYKSRKPSEGR